MILTSIVARAFVFFASVMLLTACNARQMGDIQKSSANEGFVLLGLVGYNYTDRDIDDYSVDGAGGGSVILSSLTSGGSGVTCCVKLSKNSSGPLRVMVRWQINGCRYLIRDDRSGEADSVRHFYHNEVEVVVQRDASINPKYLETHFYPDGTVQVQLVEHKSQPRLLLNGNRPDKSLFPKCKNDKKPEEWSSLRDERSLASSTSTFATPLQDLPWMPRFHRILESCI
jgi:hypothetical protein